MRCFTVLAVAVAATGCATLAKGVHYERSGNFAMPDVHGLTTDEAKDQLAQAGITGSVSPFENYTCDDPSVPETHVCVTAPRAGVTTSARIPVTLYLKAKATPSFTMPDVIAGGIRSHPTDAPSDCSSCRRAIPLSLGRQP